MTMAVCIKCGARKIGAWTPCHICGFRLEQIEDMARAAALSDHLQSPEGLRAAAREIKAGTYAFEEEQVAVIMKDLEADPKLVERVRNLRAPPPAWGILRLVVRLIIVTLMALWAWRIFEQWRM